MDIIKNKKYWAFSLIIFVAMFFYVSWALLAIGGLKNQHLVDLWGASYGSILVIALVFGIKGASSWGGWKSWLGRAMLFMAFALALEEFGQLMFSYYNVFRHVVIPYPSLADIGFFGFIPANFNSRYSELCSINWTISPFVFITFSQNKVQFLLINNILSF
jgi:hypothetical protein